MKAHHYLVAVLLLLNGLLLWFNREHMIHIETLDSQLNATQRILYPTIPEGEQGFFIKLDHPEISVVEEGLQLITILSPNSCLPCAETAIHYSKQFQKTFGGRAVTYLLGPDSSQLDPFNPLPAITPIDPDHGVLNSDFTFSNSVALLVDHNGVVHQMDICSLNNIHRTEFFYKRMESLLGSH